MILIEIREWIMLLMEGGILYYVAKEFYYDRNKDIEKKQKKTKTMKKTTTQPSGESTIEESTEVSEPMEEKK